MKLCYGAVFRGTTPLVVYSPEPGNFEKIFIDQYHKSHYEVGKTFLKVDNCLWVISHDEQDLNILLVLQDTNDKETAEQFTNEIKSRFVRAHGRDWQTAQVHELFPQFEPQFRILRQMIESSTTDKARQGEVFPPIASDSILSDYRYTFNRETQLLYKKAQRKACYLKAFALFIIFFTIIYLVLVCICKDFRVSPSCFVSDDKKVKG